MLFPLLSDHWLTKPEDSVIVLLSEASNHSSRFERADGLAPVGRFASLCFQPVAVQFRSSGIESPTESERSCPVMVRGAFAIEIDLATGFAAKAVEFSGAFAVTVTVPPPRTMALVPFISRILESLET